MTTPKRGVGGHIRAAGQLCGRAQHFLFEALFELGFANRATPRQLEPLHEFGELINTFEARAEHAKGEEAGALLDELLKTIAYERYLYDHFDERQAQSKWSNVSDFIGWVKRRAVEDDLALSAVIQSMVLISMMDKGEGEDNAGAAVHTARKGLEYPHVFWWAWRKGCCRTCCATSCSKALAH